MSFRRHLLKRMRGEKELPYIQLDYIESTGTQYINLGYHPSQDTKVETNVNILSHNVTAINYLFGVYDSTRSFAVYYSNSSYGWGVLCGTVDNNANVKYQKNIKQKVEFDRNNLSIDGTSIYTVGSTTTFTSTKTMYLFWGNGTSNNRSISRVYDFKIYENDTLVMDLIPCIRKSDGVVCMYDNVSKSFFDNQGTGDFIPGTLTNLPKGYAQVSYLESTGTQYIDIGLKVSNNTKVELVGKQYTSNSSLFGVNPLFVITSSQSNDKKQLCRFRYNNTTQDTNINILKLSKIIFDKNKGYINDVLLATFTEATFSSTYNAILFGRRINSSGTLEELAQQRIDYFKMWENDVLVRDMIPCLDDEGAPCMYDILNNKCYYNEGTGDFVYGEIIKRTGFPKGYQQLEYLQAIDGNYIFIPVTIKSTDVFRMKVKPLANDASFVMGITHNGYTSGVQLRYQSGAWQGRWGGNAWLNYKTAPINEIYEIVYKNGEIIINGETIPFTKATSGIEGTGNLGIFARQYNNKPELNIGEMQIMSFQMNDDINLVPALDSNGRPCMYDMVNYKTYYNLGEGEFLYGIKEPTKNLIKETNLGFPSGANTSISINSTYPYSYYMNDILLEKGKTYEINVVYVRTPASTDDGTVRFRMLNEDGTFWGAPASGTYTTFFDSIELSGKVGATAISEWFSFQKAVLKPKKNCYMRPLVILGTKEKTPPCAYFVDIKEV